MSHWILAFLVVLVCVLIARLGLAPALTWIFGVHGPLLEGAVTAAAVVSGIIVANKVLRVPGRR